MENKINYCILIILILLLIYLTNLYYGIILSSMISVYYAYNKNKISKMYLWLSIIIYIYGFITK